jgi:hypothetical protein
LFARREELRIAKTNMLNVYSLDELEDKLYNKVIKNRSLSLGEGDGG